MSLSMMRCPRCGGAMEPGVVMDRGHNDTTKIPTWVAGEPEVSIWTGIKTKGHDMYPVLTHRCAGCGYLESYARAAEPE